MDISGIEIDNTDLNKKEFENEDEKIVGNEEIGKKRKRGVELTNIPLCEWCSIETVGESESKVLERGLETVSKFDGGLSRNRLDKLSEEKGGLREASRILLRTPRRLRGASDLEQKTKQLINRSLRGSNHWKDFVRTREGTDPLLQDAADMGILEDGNIDDDHCDCDEEEDQVSRPDDESKPDIYVSIFDPNGEPAFKPSKTKPLPKWMSLLPRNMRRERELKGNVHSSDSQSHPHELLDLENGSGGSSMPAENRLHDNSHSSTRLHFTYLEKTPSETTDVPSAPIEIPKRGNISNTTCPGCTSPEIRRRDRSTISFDTKITREHSFRDLNRTNRRSQTVESIYVTPPEYPFKERLRKQRTPYPQARRPSLTRRESPKYFNYGPSESSKDAYCQLSWNQSPKVASPPAEPSRLSSFVPSSSGYNERYHPNSPDNRAQTYVPKETERMGKKGRSDTKWKVEDEEYDLDSRREDVRRELRNLFCEE